VYFPKLTSQRFVHDPAKDNEQWDNKKGDLDGRTDSNSHAEV
jgi:hypothetical protein